MPNERQKIKVTIQKPDGSMEMNVEGIAFVTCETRNGKNGNSVAVVGNMSIVDLLTLHRVIRTELLKTVEEAYMEDAEKHSLSDLVKALSGVI